jgi:hypothetical protein
MSREARRIVIDTSIARSAGKTEHPVSRSCREFLEQILSICHHAVMTPDIRREWKKHRSRFTATWLASMTARKKVRVVLPTADASVLEKLKKAQMGEKNEAAILKDVLLVEAALATDSVVASLEKEVRSLLSAFSKQWGQIKTVAWVNPAKDEDTAIAWLSSGALPEKERLLGYEGE